MLKKLLMLSVTAFVMVFSNAVHADRRVSEGSNYLLLRDTAGCPESVLQHINPEYHGMFNYAEAYIQGVKWNGCYTIVGDMVFVVYEDADTVTLPLTIFTEVVSAKE